MYSTKLSVSLHILSVIALSNGTPVTSDYIASSIHTNPALVRRLMSRMKKANLIDSCTGKGATSLHRPPEEIRLLDVFQAVEDEQHLFDIHHHSNPECPVGAKIEQALKAVYGQIEEATWEKLASVTLANLLADFAT